MMMGSCSKEEERGGGVVCMNELCGASSSFPQWTKGWPLRSGAFAILCHNCGTAYDQLAFCDIFHSHLSGWRDCNSCRKRLHCGCIASSSLLEILDTSGVICISCAKSSALHPTSVGSPKRFHSSFVDNTVYGDNIHNVRLKQLVDCADGNGTQYLLPLQNDDSIASHHQMKPGEMGTTFLPNFNKVSPGLSSDVKLGINRRNLESKDVHGSPVHTNLTISLAAPSGIPNLFPTVVLQEMDSSKATPSFQQRSRSHPILPKPPKPVLAETNGSSIPQIRVARPPVEGRIKNQLLPRYWPRITEQELQQISGDSNSTIVPLFEKVLSASDAGRIGRLVLPKACAEAYFPPISQPEGIPVSIQDVKRKEWVFQFRFWPNNNSRMYVLEGVTPCIQSMQLQAGDTVTFSRMEPEGKLLMGFRKASNGILMQDTNLSAKQNGSSLSGVVESIPVTGGYSGLLQSMNGNSDPHVKAFSKHSNLSGGDINWHLTDKHGCKGVGASLPPTMLGQERKRSRNLGPKSKRLLIDNQDALELKLTWEEIQEMFRPPTSASPTTITIEDYEFEEYDDPPVFGKRSIFTVRLSGEQEQWVTCDNCSKWRRLPSEFLIPPIWRCPDNVWDRSRCSCSAPEELSPQELKSLLKQNNDFKRQRIESQGTTPERESTIADSLTGSTIRGDVSDPGATSVAATTKHPRHRPGCSCIVCIQPPSGKGKHKPTCTCNVCMTVKRRFKTLMMRKKKRQSEREAEIAPRNQFIWGSKEELEVDSTPKQVIPQVDLLETEVALKSELQSLDQDNQSQKVMDTNHKELDLNSRPFPGEDFPTESTRLSMMSLLQVANRPLETYLKQNGLTSLTSEQQQASSGSHAAPHATMDSEGQPQGDNPVAPVDEDQERGHDVELYELVQVGNDPS